MTCYDIIYRHVANHGYKAFEDDIISLRSFCSNVAYALTRAKNIKKTETRLLILLFPAGITKVKVV